MKFSLVLLAGFCTLAISTPLEEYKVADDHGYLEKQQQILKLFEHINQPSYYDEHLEIAKAYNFEDHVDQYTKQEVVKNFTQYWKYGMLPRGEIFSIMYQEHMEQAIALFRMFYYAKDYETFYKTAVWARQYVNEGMFLYSFSVALVHRPDTQAIALPPIYEIYPHYFYNSETIHKAYLYKQKHYFQEKQPESKYNNYFIFTNYSGYYLNLHPEQSLSYYLEDVGINAFYYYYNLYYPFWMSSEEYGLKYYNRGEEFYYMHQQLLARYYVERLSNGFGEIPYFNWEGSVETPYYPSLEYPNGLEFPSRPKFANLYEYFYNYGQSWTTRERYGFSPSYVKDCERRINEAIDLGYAYTHDGKKVDLFSKEGLDILGNLIEGNPDSPYQKYYKAIWYYARHLLGYSFQPLDKYHVVPSALEHFETSLRDPVFYQLYKKIVFKFQRYKGYLPPYTKDELVFQGIKVVDVEFDRLFTYFEKFQSDITNAAFYSPEELQNNAYSRIYAIQDRLNHKPFNYKVVVKSDKAAKAAIKIYYGPKYDEYGRYINITENRINMVQFDQFVYDLKSGENVITRNSRDNYFYSSDYTSYYDLYEQHSNQQYGQKGYQFNNKQYYFYFPQRYMLPKGCSDGMTFQFYVIVSPYVPYGGQQEQHDLNNPKYQYGGQYIDGYPLGYPFDRHIKFEQMFYQVPNSYFYETKIYHKYYKDDKLQNDLYHYNH